MANFGPDISIIRMKLLQFTLKGINVGGRKTIGGRSSTTPHLVRNVWVSRSSPLRIDQPPHDVQDVQRPAALRGFDFADGFELGVTGQNLGGVGWRTGGNDGDAGFGRKPNMPISRTDPFLTRFP